MAADVRLTVPLLKLLRVFLERPSAPIYGLELARLAELKTGTIYPALARLEEAGWLVSRWEAVDPAEEGRPRRRLYELTPDGCELALAALGSVGVELDPRTRRRLATWRPGEQST